MVQSGLLFFLLFLLLELRVHCYSILIDNCTAFFSLHSLLARGGFLLYNLLIRIHTSKFSLELLFFKLSKFFVACDGAQDHFLHVDKVKYVFAQGDGRITFHIIIQALKLNN